MTEPTDRRPPPATDELLARYREATALEALDGPDANLRAAVLAHAQVQAWKRAALDEDDSPQPQGESPTPWPTGGAAATEADTASVLHPPPVPREAANDRRWYMAAVASVAVLGLAGLLALQFERGGSEAEKDLALGRPAAPQVTKPSPPPATASAPASAPTAAAPVDAVRHAAPAAPSPTVAASFAATASAPAAETATPPVVAAPTPAAEPPAPPREPAAVTATADNAQAPLPQTTQVAASSARRTEQRANVLDRARSTSAPAASLDRTDTALPELALGAPRAEPEGPASLSASPNPATGRQRAAPSNAPAAKAAPSAEAKEAVTERPRAAATTATAPPALAAPAAAPAPAPAAAPAPITGALQAPEPRAPTELTPSQRLLVAAASGQLEGARDALSQGAAPNTTDGAGRTALMLAARRGDVGMVRLLQQAGADVRRTDREGLSAIDHARRAGHEALARHLEAPPGQQTP